MDDSYSISGAVFDDLLLSSPVTLSLNIPSPVDLFLTSRDLDAYGAIHAYLLSVRRGHTRLTELWKRTSLRRDHPAPLGPPYSNSASGLASNVKKRERACARARVMRKVWATSGAAVFLLAELGEYFQGEVVRGSWEVFQIWLGDETASQKARAPEQSHANPNHASELDGVDDASGDDIWATKKTGPYRTSTKAHAASNRSHDPETLTRAHQTYLRSLVRSLLLSDGPFTQILRDFLQLVDELAATVSRLQQVWQTLDLETDDVSDARQDEREALAALADLGSRVKAQLGRLTDRLRTMDADRSASRSTLDLGFGGRDRAHDRGGDNGTAKDAFMPWNGGGVDRLLMKLDFGSLVVGEREETVRGGEKSGRDAE